MAVTPALSQCLSRAQVTAGEARRPSCDCGVPGATPRGCGVPEESAAGQSNEGLRSLDRLSSKNPSALDTSTRPSHSSPAASPLGAGVMTGPNRALPRILTTGV